MSSPPYSYDYMNVANGGFTPSTVHVHNTAVASFFRRYLIQRAMANYKWEMPEHWEENYFLYCLYELGYVGIFNTARYGVIPQQCTLSGRGVMYQPTDFIVTNPLISGSRTVKIGVMGALIRLQPNYNGISDLVAYYGDMMALVWETVSVNIINSKLSYVFFAENQTQAEAYKKLYDNLSCGNPAAFVGRKQFKNANDKNGWEPFSQNVGTNYIAGDLLIDLRKIEQMFLNEIGYPTANTEKRERMLNAEVNVNNAESYGRAEMWLDFLKKQCKQASDMFGIKLSVDWRYPPMKGGADNGEAVLNGNVSVEPGNPERTSNTDRLYSI